MIVRSSNKHFATLAQLRACKIVQSALCCTLIACGSNVTLGVVGSSVVPTGPRAPSSNRWEDGSARVGISDVHARG
jgi:hypothetical protein